MPGSHLFNLGLNQKHFLSTSKVAGTAINLGSTKGRGSSTRMFNYCKQYSKNTLECINQFIIDNKNSITNYSSGNDNINSSDSGNSPANVFNGGSSFTI